MANKLINEKSPYLLQHAHNPVDWYPWGDAAFERAQAENRPIFLSIGYATCHWCHVMEKESFEDQEVADLLNRDYVCIKVDREERPDIDQVFMDVCVRLTGSGGWPLTLFLTPDRQPFFAGTYFPKQSYGNRPGLVDYLPLIAERWRDRPAEFNDRAQEVLTALQTEVSNRPGQIAVTPEVFNRTTLQLQQRFDSRHGGFGDAPKFPSPHTLAYLLWRYRRDDDLALLQIVTRTLEAMRRGGIYDQVGFGFHRYATDRQWLVPHFEKMLYDQAGLAEVYLDAFQITGEPLFARTAREICSYVLRDLTGPDGGFYSAQDADSEGEEGKFYLWSIAEVTSLLGAEAGARWCRLFNLEENGNYLDEATRSKTGRNIPHLQTSLDQLAAAEELSVEQLQAFIEESRKSLFAGRQRRVPPLTDDKVLTAWNGMMISALASCGRILDEHAYLSAADKAADFILSTLRSPDGSLLRRYRDGDAAIAAFAEDYAFLARGLLDLYRATFNPTRLRQAIELGERLATQFLDAESGLVFETPHGSTELFIRPKNLFDGAHPSTNSITLQLFARLYQLTGEPLWKQRGETLLQGLAASLQAYPSGFTSALQGAALLLEPTREVVLAGDPATQEMRDLERAGNRYFCPETAVLQRPDTANGTITELAPFTRQMHSDRHQAVAYVCQAFSCQQPISDAGELAALLNRLPDRDHSS